MKRLIIAIVFSALFAAGLAVFAQDNNNQNEEGKQGEIYYKNISLERIFPYRTGYVVQYRRGFRLVNAYLPMEWFSNSAGKGEVIALPQGPSWPSMSVYYRDGEFSHVRLYVHRSPSHKTWGVIPQNVNIDDRFENVKEPDIKY
jgi:hypothetical protein